MGRDKLPGLINISRLCTNFSYIILYKCRKYLYSFSKFNKYFSIIDRLRNRRNSIYIYAHRRRVRNVLFCNNVWNVSPLDFKITAIFFLVRKVSAFSGDKCKWATFLQVNRTEIIRHPTPYSRARVFSATLLSKSSCTCAKILFFFFHR